MTRKTRPGGKVSQRAGKEKEGTAHGTNQTMLQPGDVLALNAAYVRPQSLQAKYDARFSLISRLADLFYHSGAKLQRLRGSLACWLARNLGLTL